MLDTNNNMRDLYSLDDRDLIELCSGSNIAKFAEELAKEAQMPRNTTLFTVLSIFSSVACRAYKVNYRCNSGSNPLSINFCGEQPPATAKSRILSTSQRAINHMVREDKKVILKKMSAKETELSTATEKEEKSVLKSELFDLQSQLNALFDFMTDTTPEALDSALRETNGYYSIASAEQGAINTLMGISYGDGKGVSNRDLVLKGWNGEWHSSRRKGRDGYKGDVVGAITAIAQDGMIERLLTASDNSGVVERFILWTEGTLLGERTHTKYYTMNKNIVKKYDDAVINLYQKIRNKDYQDLPALNLSERAWDKINQIRDALEPTIGNDGENANVLLRGIIGKYDIHVMKIASCLHLSNDQENQLVHDDRVNEAMAIVDCYIMHIKMLILNAEVEAYSEREKAVIKVLASKRPIEASALINKVNRKKCFRDKKSGASRNTQAVTDTIDKLCKKGVISINHLANKERISLA